jgi:hypothetical protein
MKSLDGKGADQGINEFETERDDAMTHRSEDYYSQMVGKGKRRKRIQDRRKRDTEDFLYEKPVKRPRNKNFRYVDDEGYYG